MSMIIREVTTDDAAAIEAIYRPYVLETPISFEETPPDAGEIAGRIAGITAQYPWLVAEVAGGVAGYVYGCAHRARASYRWSVDVAVYLDRAYHRRGIGARLYRALLPLLRAQGYITAYAGITLPNPASVGLHQAVGFTPLCTYPHVGFKGGRWLEVGWWHLPLVAPLPTPPAEPIPWPELKRSLDLHALLTEAALEV